MAGNRLPRWVFSWVGRWFPWRVRVRRPVVRYAMPALEILEERGSPTAIALPAQADLAPSHLEQLNSLLRSRDGESRTTSDRESLTASETIRLVTLPSPSKGEDIPTRKALPPPVQPSFLEQFRSHEEEAAPDDLSGRVPARHASHSADAQHLPGGNNAPGTQALAGAGAGTQGAPSTPNAVGGGAGASGGGGGGNTTNANPFLSAYLNMLGSALTPAPAAATPSPVMAAPAAATPPAPATAPNTPTTSAARPGTPATPPDGAPTTSHRQSPAAPFAVLDASTGDIAPAISSPTLAGVFDMDNGQSLPRNVTVNTFSTYNLDLLAQTGIKTNATYSWDTSKAPDLTNVSGQNTMNLQGTWANFTGATRTDTVTVTETPQGGMPDSWTTTFLVAGTNSPAYSATPPTSSATWPTVLTPDQIVSDQASVDVGP